MVAEAEPLLETGTRFEHWSELLEAFRNAVVIIDKNYPTTLRTSASMDMQKNRVKIENAIELVESQLNRLANRDEQQYKLAMVIERLPKNAEDIHDDEQRLLSTGEPGTTESGETGDDIVPHGNC